MAKKEKRHSEAKIRWGKYVFLILFFLLIFFFLWGMNKLFDFVGFVPSLDTQETQQEETR